MTIQTNYEEFEFEKAGTCWWTDTRGPGHQYPWSNVGPALTLWGAKRLLRRELRKERNAKTQPVLQGHDSSVTKIKKAMIKLP